jgi:hypothetical protein
VISSPIRQPLPNNSLQGAIRARNVINAKGNAIAVGDVFIVKVLAPKTAFDIFPIPSM